MRETNVYLRSKTNKPGPLESSPALSSLSTNEQGTRDASGNRLAVDLGSVVYPAVQTTPWLQRDVRGEANFTCTQARASTRRLVIYRWAKGEHRVFKVDAFPREKGHFQTKEQGSVGGTVVSVAALQTKEQDALGRR